MCQYKNILKNTGDKEKIVFKLLLLGPKANSWVTPFMKKELITGVRYDGGKIDIHYSKKKEKIGGGYFHCYETYEDALNDKQKLFLGTMYFIVKCVIPENTAYYEGYYHLGYDYSVDTSVKTIATRSIIVDEMMIDIPTTVPQTLSEAVSYLQDNISDEDKKFLVENGAISVHHTLGRWIRNNWGLWEDSELKKNLEVEGFTHPDDMSNYIIEEFVKTLV